jgi:hypothetical protein
MNLELCNLSKLWKNAATTEPANIISYYDQDYVCLLTEVPSANNLTLNLNNVATCLKSIGLLKINQPKNTLNSGTINLYSGIKNIHSIIIGPNSTLNIAGSHNSMGINFLNSSKLDINGSNGLNLTTFQCSTDYGCSLSKVTGTINTLSDSSGQMRLTNSKLSNSNIQAYNINIDIDSNLTNCNLKCINTLNLFTNQLYNTFCSGYNINYTANKFDLACTVFDTITINASLINGGTIIGSGPRTTIRINGAKLVTALRLEKIPYLEITASESCEVRGTYSPSETLNIKGGDSENNALQLSTSFSTNAKSTKAENFINYGTINSNTVTLSNGSNYGVIRGRYLSIDDSVNNYGTIEQL